MIHKEISEYFSAASSEANLTDNSVLEDDGDKFDKWDFFW